MTTHASILDRLTAGRALPKGCDSWALKATNFAGRTTGGFPWPGKGWVEAAGPFTEGDPCPSAEGDGLCVALTYLGLASGGHRALCLLLVAYHSKDVLGSDDDKVRLSRCRVVERLDGEAALREHGTGANLEFANLTGADLTGADLTGANLGLANLTGANLWGANLAGANLWSADLTDANLTGANLTDANLWRANLAGHDLDDLRARGALGVSS